MTTPRTIEQATSLDVDVCEHGNMTLTLYDEEGRAFATASFPLRGAMDFINDAAEKVAAYGIEELKRRKEARH